MVRCFADIVKSYNWRKVIAIYEDDVFGSVSSTVFLLSNALHSIGSEIEYRVIFPPADSISESRDTVREELKLAKSLLSTVYIILRISETLAQILFEEADSQGLMTKGYIWICGNDITTLLDSSFTPSFISKYMQGLVGIRSYINETTPEYVNFQSTFQQRFKIEYERSGENSFDPGVYAVRAYDVVDAISLAVAATKSETNNKTLAENLLASNFIGLSGVTRQTNGCLDESDRYSTFNIINVIGKSYRVMGIWVDGKGFYENEKDYMLLKPCTENLESLVFWPGGPHASPAGLTRLKVVVPGINIWENFVTVENTGNSSSYSGFCIDVFTAILSCLNYEVQYEFLHYNEIKYDELVNNVHLGVFDILVGDVTILANRSENVSFTKPYMSSGLTMLVPVEVNRKEWLPTKAFSLSLWMCILALLLYYIMLVWFHELAEDVMPDFWNNWRKQLGASLWIVSNGIFLNLDRRIRSYHTKIVIILWFFVAQLVLNSFTASLSSVLVTENLRPEVDKGRLGCDNESFVPEYLNSVLNISWGRIIQINNTGDYVKGFKAGTITAAYLEVPYLRVFLSQHDNYTVNGETRMLGGLGFVLPKGSLLASDMSEAILKLGENGALRQLEKKWFSISLSNYVALDDDSNQSLGLSDYTYVFVISSCLAFLTVLHSASGQVGAPEEALPLEPLQEQVQEPQHVQQVVLPNDQSIQQGINNVSAQQTEMEVVPLHDERHENSDTAVPRNRLRRAASTPPNLSMAAHILFSVLSVRSRHVQEIEQQHLRDGAQHEVEDQPNLELHNNDGQPYLRNFGQRFQRAASSLNILSTTTAPQRFHSLPLRRIRENEEQPLCFSVAHEMEEQIVHDEHFERGEQATRMQNTGADPGPSGILRYRRFNSAN